MSIFERIRRITMANINGLLDKAEDPETMLEQKIYELEETVLEAKEALAAFSVSFKKAEKEYNGIQSTRDEWKGHAVAALKGDDETTAKKALEEKVKLEQRMERLLPSVREGKETYEQLKAQLVLLNDQLKQAHLKLSEFKSRKRTAMAQKTFGGNLDRVVDGVRSDEFEKMEDEVLLVESEVEVEHEMRGDLLTTLDMEKLACDMKVADELDALKKELGK